MLGIGLPELLIILVIVLIIFGAGKLPELGGAIGKSIRSFKRSVHEKEMIDARPESEKAANKQ